ncbi:hypothetical protein DI005_18570 [Prauserella sp. PE36]|uniref:hypothetical protein n=1 Tax=Prauserella sp. PE36 TaxID=1504709 RepID=UPI000DE3D6BE|nr:hypothetical protein [Prauserella sp. PE36]RBM18474.1 hypothetical protein DI005_18570 [Prauserella sp. PE36]
MSDPHVHVGRDVVHGDAAARNLVASTIGLVGELPSTLTTGCGSTVPYVMTSPRPETVTCLPCRDYTRAQRLRFATARHRNLADRFGGLT